MKMIDEALEILAEMLVERDKIIAKMVDDYPTMTVQEYIDYAIGKVIYGEKRD